MRGGRRSSESAKRKEEELSDRLERLESRVAFLTFEAEATAAQLREAATKQAWLSSPFGKRQAPAPAPGTRRLTFTRPPDPHPDPDSPGLRSASDPGPPLPTRDRDRGLLDAAVKHSLSAISRTS